MGKISDALERHKKEIVIQTDHLPTRRPEEVVPKKPESRRPRQKPIGQNYNHKLVVASSPDSVDAENFKVLRSQILFPKEGRSPRTIMITSAFPGEGKTYVAANLAVSIAKGVTEYVLLVDCDLRRPSVHHMFGSVNREGLHEYLTNKKDLPDLIMQTGVDKLSLLTAGTTPNNPSELLSSTSMKAFLEEVKNRYDDRYVVIDATPSQVTSEANVLANYVDAIIFVVMSAKAPRETIKRSIDNLGKDKVLGVVFNGYSESHKSYEKYYKKYYKGS